MFLADPYSVKRNVARTLNSQLVYEYILHCLRATYKYFALPHKHGAKNNEKEPLESSILQKPEQNALKHSISDIKDTHNEAEELVVGSCADTIKESSHVPEDHVFDLSQVFGTESLLEQPLADDIEHLGIAPGDSDCIIEEFISGDNEEFKPSCEDTESGNEEEEEEGNQHVRKWQMHLGIIQGLDEDSESGDMAVPTSEHDIETDSISDLENFHNAVIAVDEFNSECREELNEKADIDEGSTEGSTDELEDSLIKLEPSAQKLKYDIDNSEEEEEEQIINQEQRGNITNTEDELDNIYTGSGDEEALSEEEELFISVKYKDTETKKVDEHPKISSLAEDAVEKGESNEGNLPLDQYSASEFFYEFNKAAFTKGKVIIFKVPKYY